MYLRVFLITLNPEDVAEKDLDSLRNEKVEDLDEQRSG